MIRKDSRMDLLIRLLNEYLKTKDTEIHKTNKVFAFEEATKSFIAENGTSYRQERVISKRFKFIKFLLDNGYIDYTEVIRKKWYWTLENEMISLDEGRYYEILMLLSISEDPIRLLIYILK